MNVEDTAGLIRKHFPDAVPIRESVYRVITHRGENPVTLKIFDLSRTVENEAFDLDAYQEELLRQEFYRNAGSLQWNIYDYLLCDERVYGSLREKGLVKTIEANRKYARKFVRTPIMLRDDLIHSERISAKSSSAITSDVGSQWRKKLDESGLSVVASDRPYAEAVRIIMEHDMTPRTPSTATRSDEVVEDKVGFIDGLKLQKFRQRPSQKDFLFGKCNLFHGANGAGKTSLLEAIEAWICGANRRNPGEKPNKIQLKLRGAGAWQEGPAERANYYRNRDHLWYGNFQARRNDLCYNFGRFNFFDSDASARLEIAKSDTEIEKSLSSLVLGSEAAKLSERIEKILASLKKEEGPLRQRVQDAENSLRTAKANIAQVQEPTESVSHAYERLKSQLSEVGWKEEVPSDSAEGCLSLIENLHLVSVILKTAVSNVPWMRSISLSSLTDEASALRETLDALHELDENNETLKQQHSETAERLSEYNHLEKILRRWLEYVDSGATRLGVLTDSLTRQERRITLLNEVADNISEIDLPAYAAISEAADELIDKKRKTLTKKRSILAKAKADCAAIESAHKKATALLSQIRSKALDYIESEPSVENCPVCGVLHGRHALLGLLNQELERDGDRDLQGAHATVLALEKETAGLKLSLEHIETICSSASLVSGSKDTESIPLKNHVAILLDLDSSLRKCENERSEALRTIKHLHAKNFNEEELSSLVEKLELAYQDIFRSPRAMVEGYLKKSDSLRAADGDTLKKLATDIERVASKKRKLLNKHFGDETADANDVEDRITAISESLEQLNLIAGRVEWEKSQALSAVATKVSAVTKLVESVMALQKQVESVSMVINQNETAIKTADATLKTERPIYERIQKSIAVLEGIQSHNSAEKNKKDFIQKNLERINDLFMAIHSPRDFKEIIWSAEDHGSIGAIRESGSRKECPVSQFSSGQRNALSLAIFLTMNQQVDKGPPLILLDDPVAHVDDLNIVSFFDCLRELLFAGNRQIFFATASSKTANLFAKKFDFLGRDEDFFSYELVP
jgi:DNA repair exonuclease SbcCD ATPase subunit